MRKPGCQQQLRATALSAAGQEILLSGRHLVVTVIPGGTLRVVCEETVAG